MTASNMAYAPPALLFLLLPLLIHAYQNKACPDQVDYRCPDFYGSWLMFPFTNTTLRDCGYCVLECKNSTNTTFRCAQQQLAYITKVIFPFNNTVVLEYPGLHKLVSNVCNVHQSDSVIFPDPPLTSFTILHLMVFYRCQLGDDDNPARKIPYTDCGGGDLVYGPYSEDKVPKGLPSGCREIKLPNSIDDSFSVGYKLPDQCLLCAHDSSRCNSKLKCGKGKMNLSIILGSVLTGCFLTITSFLLLYWRKRMIKQGSPALILGNVSFNGTKSYLEEATMSGVTLFSYNELKEATNDFDSTRELGEGGFGVVYYGKLRDGREVAVKRLYEKNYKRIQQFKNEIKILTDLHHKNLVTLYGCTSHHSQELLLVYEYIPNGTVADHLYGDRTNSEFITWSTRMNIAIETAEALSYLHCQDIIHRDVKTNNILLDSNFSVKVADFGLSRLFPADVTHVSTAPQGTPGYLDPEYHQCYHLTDKSDVYSFGVVLIELISSLPAVDIGRHRHEVNLSNYAVNRIQVCAFNELVDPKLGFEKDSKVRRMTTLVAELAFQCLQQERELRPSIDEVLHELQRIMACDCEAPEKKEIGIRVEKIGPVKSLPSSKACDTMEPAKSVQPSSSSAEPVGENEGLKILTVSQGQPRAYSQKKYDNAGFLRNAQPLQTSPDSVMDKWSYEYLTAYTSS